MDPRNINTISTQGSLPDYGWLERPGVSQGEKGEKEAEREREKAQQQHAFVPRTSYSYVATGQERTYIYKQNTYIYTRSPSGKCLGEWRKSELMLV